MNRFIKLIFWLLIVIISLFLGYIIGYKNAYDKMENNNLVSLEDYQTFYAKILKITDNILLVEGLDVNDIKFRQNYEVMVIGETKILCNNENLNLSDLKVGDNIMVTFDGKITKSNPGQINNVFKIELLRD